MWNFFNICYREMIKDSDVIKIDLVEQTFGNGNNRDITEILDQWFNVKIIGFYDREYYPNIKLCQEISILSGVRGPPYLNNNFDFLKTVTFKQINGDWKPYRYTVKEESLG